jgi:nitroreductase
MNPVTDAIRHRRSIRRYADTPVPRDVAEKIVSVAEYAPSAGNRQAARIVVCFDRAVNAELGRINRAAYTGAAPAAGTVSSDQPSIKDDGSIADGYYGAPCMVYLFGPETSWYRDADSWILADQISLAAYSEGLGTCLVSRACETFSSPYGRERAREWGVPDDFAATVQICLGYPADGFPPPRPRAYAPVRFVG